MKRVLFILSALTGTLLCISCKEQEAIVNPQPVTGSLFDQRDSVTYTTVLINGQWWMSENLNYGKTIDSKSGGDNADGLPSNNGIPEKYCYGDNVQSCDQYGGLYVWDEMMNYTTTEGGQGVCPDGWHIPSRADWESLISEYPSSLELLENGSSGFNGLLGGNKYEIEYGNLEILGAYWSSSGNQSSFAYYILLNRSSSPPLIQQERKIRAFSVRCVRDTVP